MTSSIARTAAEQNSTAPVTASATFPVMSFPGESPGLITYPFKLQDAKASMSAAAQPCKAHSPQTALYPTSLRNPCTCSNLCRGLA